MTTVLITGGLGFIGSHLVEALVRRGDTVRVLDNSSTGNIDNIAAVRGDVQMILGDIRDPLIVLTAMKGVEIIYHQAALTSVPESTRIPLQYADVNVVGTVNVLDAAQMAGVRRVVYASSSAVYGSSPGRIAPLNPYAASKLAGEYFAQVFYNLHGLETVGLRYFNVYGPRQRPDSGYAAVVPKFITAALASDALSIHGDGLQRRDFIYVDDVVRFNLLASTMPGVGGQVYDVGTGNSLSVLEVKQALGDVFGYPLDYIHAEARPGDARTTLADAHRTATALGYHARTSFTDGLRQTVRCFQESQETP